MALYWSLFLMDVLKSFFIERRCCLLIVYDVIRYDKEFALKN